MAVLHARTERQCATWLFALALAINVTLAWYWIAVAKFPPTGDEGHYLMISRSLAEDRDVEMRGDYANTQRELRTFGIVVDDPHCWKAPGGWYSLHYPGLSAMVALPYELFGIAGARFTMCLIGACLIVLLFRILNRYLGDSAWALGLACSFYFGLLYLAASNQIYPDLPAGIAILAVADVCMRYFRKIQPGTREFVLAILLLAFLPWLHMKYLVPMTLLAVTLAWQIFRGPSPSGRRIFGGAAVLGLSVAGLFAYNLHCFGALTGPLDAFSISKVAPAVMVYVGLHLDQAQGLFLQQPLYLLGVLGLVALWREDRRVFLWLVLLYHSILLPNATHPNWYGGYSFAGRYLWSCSLLWIYPTAAFLTFLRAVAPAVFKPAVTLAALYQAVLACEWIPQPQVLLSTASEKGLARNTLFGGNVRYALPSFYDPKLYPTEAVNLLAAAGFVLLALAGGLLLRKRYTAVKMVGFGYMVCLAIFSPGVPSREYARDVEDTWMRNFKSWVQDRTFEAETLKVPENSPAKIVKDAAASGGLALQVTPDPRVRGREDFFFYGPYATMSPGSYAADFVLRAVDVSMKDKVALLDVNGGTSGSLGTLEIAGTDFHTAGVYQTFRVKFKLSRLEEGLEFRCRHSNRTGLTADRVNVVRLPSEP